MTEKKKTWTQCSKYIRLRDAIAFCKANSIDLSEFNDYRDLPVKCCTCGIIRTFRTVDAGHFHGRGLGGGSGTYFDERNIHAQCKRCNGFHGGQQAIYKEFMLEKYGQAVLDKLQVLHSAGRKYQYGELEAMGILFKEMFEELLKEL